MNRNEVSLNYAQLIKSLAVDDLVNSYNYLMFSKVVQDVVWALLTSVRRVPRRMRVVVAVLRLSMRLSCVPQLTARPRPSLTFIARGAPASPAEARSGTSRCLENNKLYGFSPHLRYQAVQYLGEHIYCSPHDNYTQFIWTDLLEKRESNNSKCRKERCPCRTLYYLMSVATLLSYLL